jgi:hypothetical protein
MTKHKPVAAGFSPLAALPDVDTHGDEPMTEKQAVKLRALTEQTGEKMDGNLNRRQAAKRIAVLEEIARD